jgi:hypothetical protein
MFEIFSIYFFVVSYFLLFVYVWAKLKNRAWAMHFFFLNLLYGFFISIKNALYGILHWVEEKQKKFSIKFNYFVY